MWCRGNLAPRTAFALPARWPDGFAYPSSSVSAPASSPALQPITRAHQRAGQFVADDACRDARGRDRRVEVDVDVNAAVAQHVDEVLGGDVAGRAGCERAAAQ